MALFAVLALGLSRKRRWIRVAVPSAAAALYLRRHHVDVPAVAALTFLEACFAFGTFALRWLGATASQSADRTLQFLTGLCSACIVLLVLSLLGYGRPSELLYVGFAACIASLAVARTELVSVQAMRALGALSQGAQATLWPWAFSPG